MQKNHLTNMAFFHHFCLRQSKTAQILYEGGGALFFLPPCRDVSVLAHGSFGIAGCSFCEGLVNFFDVGVIAIPSCQS